MTQLRELIKENKKIVGKIIRAIRRSKDITQTQISNKLGVSQPVFIQKIESGVRHLDVSELWELCKILDISFTEIAQKIDEAFKKQDSEKKYK